MSASIAYRDLIVDHAQKKWGPLKNAQKLLGRMLGISGRTVEKYLSGEGAPGGETLMNWLASDDDLYEAFVSQIEIRRASIAQSANRINAASQQFIMNKANADAAPPVSSYLVEENKTDHFSSDSESL